MCAICDHRPAKARGICANCQAKLDSEKRKRKAEQPVKYATYRGHTIGFFKNDGGKLVPRLLKRNPENLPKYMTLDLNTYIEGLDRATIKRIKSAILTLAHA